MSESTVNHYEVCCLLYAGSITQAQHCFYEKIKGQDLSASARNMILSSLNYAIYNYLLLQDSISLHECCIKCEQLISHAATDAFRQTADDIIAAYGSYILNLRNRYENPQIRRAVSYIHEHLNEELTLKKVSELLFMNKNYFCQLFCRETGVSFASYVCEQRMQLSRRLLCGTDLSVQQVAERSGFLNAAYFSTCFRKYYGCTPSQLRKC